MPRAKSPKPTLSKSDFVRSQPATLSAVDVLAKAKAAGLKITRQLVYKVRSDGHAKGNSKKTSGKTSAAANGAVTSKAAFVRSLSSLSPKEIIVKAKTAGLKLDIGYVYNIRGAGKTAAKKKRAAAKSPAVRTVTNGGGSSVSARAQNLLKAVASEIGLAPAIAILEGERARVHVLLRG